MEKTFFFDLCSLAWGEGYIIRATSTCSIVTVPSSSFFRSLRSTLRSLSVNFFAALIFLILVLSSTSVPLHSESSLTLLKNLRIDLGILPWPRLIADNSKPKSQATELNVLKRLTSSSFDHLEFCFLEFFDEDGSAFEKSLHFEYFDSDDTSINTKE